MKNLYDSEKPLTVQNLIDILQLVPDKENTLIVTEVNNHWHDIDNVYKVHINYNNCIVISPSLKGVARKVTHNTIICDNL